MNIYDLEVKLDKEGISPQRASMKDIEKYISGAQRKITFVSGELKPDLYDRTNLSAVFGTKVGKIDSEVIFGPNLMFDKGENDLAEVIRKSLALKLDLNCYCSSYRQALNFWAIDDNVIYHEHHNPFSNHVNTFAVYSNPKIAKYVRQKVKLDRAIKQVSDLETFQVISR